MLSDWKWYFEFRRDNKHLYEAKISLDGAFSRNSFFSILQMPNVLESKESKQSSFYPINSISTSQLKST